MSRRAIDHSSRGKAAIVKTGVVTTKERIMMTGELTNRTTHNPKLAFFGAGRGNGSPEAANMGVACPGLRAPAGTACWVAPDIFEGIMPGATFWVGADWICNG